VAHLYYTMFIKNDKLKKPKIILSIIFGVLFLGFLIPSVSKADIIQPVINYGYNVGEWYSNSLIQTLGTGISGIATAFDFRIYNTISSYGISYTFSFQECTDVSYSSCVAIATTSSANLTKVSTATTTIDFPNVFLNPQYYYRVVITISGGSYISSMAYVYGSDYDTYSNGSFTASNQGDLEDMYFTLYGVFFDTEPVDNSYIDIFSVSTSSSNIILFELSHYLDDQVAINLYIYV